MYICRGARGPRQAQRQMATGVRDWISGIGPDAEKLTRPAAFRTRVCAPASKSLPCQSAEFNRPELSYWGEVVAATAEMIYRYPFASSLEDESAGIDPEAVVGWLRRRL